MVDALTDGVVSHAQTGSGAAFRAIYNHLAPAVNGYLLGKGVDDSEAITQDVFLAAFGQIASVTGGAVGLRKLVFHIAHARMVDHVRAVQRKQPTIEYSADLDTRASPSAESTVVSGMERDRLLLLLDRLAADQREVILLRVIGDLPLADVAQVMGKSVGAVKQIQRRGLGALRVILDTTGGGDDATYR